MYKPRDHERAMYIYHARKDDKRTFADIGRELGVTSERVRAIYRRLDWQLNGMDADHHKDDPSFPPPWFDVARDEETGKAYIVSKNDEK